jgi:hypothetical protein
MKTDQDLIFERYTQTKILPENESADEDVELEEGIISNVVKSVGQKFNDAAVKKLIQAIDSSTTIEVIVELDKFSPKKRSDLHRAITGWLERNPRHASAKNLERLKSSLAESTELEEDDNDQYAPEDAPADDQFGGMEPEEDESLGDSSDFEEKAEKFADALGDDELKFLHTLRDDQFPILMDFIKDEVGYRNQTFAEGDEY